MGNMSSRKCKLWAKQDRDRIQSDLLDKLLQASNSHTSDPKDWNVLYQAESYDGEEQVF